MNYRGVMENSPVQQMMVAGNPSWWNMNNLIRPPLISSHHHQLLLSSSSSSSSSATTHFLAPSYFHDNNSHNNNNNNNDDSVFQAAQYNMGMSTASPSSWLDDHLNNNNNNNNQEQQQSSWSQLLGGVFIGEEAKKMGSWEEQVMLQHHNQQTTTPFVDVKQESSVNSYNNNNNNIYTNHGNDQEFQLAAAAKATNCWSHPSQINIPVSSPQSCVTTFSSNNNMLDFSSSMSSDNLRSRHPLPVQDRSSECKSTATGGALKKAKVQTSSTQSTTFKVRKEKLGDRITALHQLVSPFGKTDTASVLLEAIGYIRFLHSQIEALSLPYLNSGAAGNMRHQPVSIQGERKCIFPEDPGQLLNDNCLKRKGGPDQGSYEEPKKDLRSRGLCLVPVSCTLHVGSDNGADYWAPALDGGFR